MFSALKASAARSSSSVSTRVCGQRSAKLSVHNGAGNVPAVHATARRYAATAVAAEARRRSHSRRSPASSSRDSGYLDDFEDSSGRPSSSSRTSSSYPPPPKSIFRTKADPEPILEHLRELFPGLEFPPDLAVQMLTHVSAKEAWATNNTRLSYVGRRVLSTYLLLFLHRATTRLSSSSSSHLVSPSSSQFDFDNINYRAMYTALIGECVGRAWNLQRSMLWTPPISFSRSNLPLSEDRAGSGGSGLAPGLFKVQGTTVEAIIGGIYHQFGGLVTQRVFHTRFLPHILCPGEVFGLHDSFHGSARNMMERMGGPNCNLSSSSTMGKMDAITDDAPAKDIEAHI